MIAAAILGKWRLLPAAWRGWLIVGAVGIYGAVVFSAGWKVNGWRLTARFEAERAAAVSAAVEAYRDKLDRAEAMAQVDADADAATSALLEDIRRERDLALDELAARPTLTRTVTKVLRDDCPVCNCPALGGDFRRVWNDPLGTAARPADPGAPPPD